MHFFSVSSSESESEDERSVQGDDVAKTQIKAIWFQSSDDEEIEERHDVISKVDKALKESQVRCDTFDYQISRELWSDAFSTFAKIKECTRRFVRSYGRAPDPVVSCIQDMPDLDEFLRGKERNDFVNKLSFTRLKLLVVQVREFKEEYAKELSATKSDLVDAGDRASDDGSTDDNETSAKLVTEEDYSNYLSDIADSFDVDVISKVERVIRECQQKGFPNAATTAMGIAVSVILRRDRRRLCVRSDTWTRAYKWGVKFFTSISEDPSIRFAENSSSSNLIAVTVPGGMHGFLVFLHEELRNKAKFENIADQEYANIPTFENNLAVLTDYAAGYYIARKKTAPLKVCIDILLDILGQRRQAAHHLFLQNDEAPQKLTIIKESIFDTVSELHNLSIQLHADKQTTIAAACHLAYQYALNGRYCEGRDYLLRSGITKKITVSNAPLAILLNRAIAQLGLAAFLAGDVATAHKLLRGIWGLRSNQMLLGQSTPHRRPHNRGCSRGTTRLGRVI